VGPVQVLVVGFEHPKFTGEVLAELTRLRQAGVVRLLDVLLVERSADGTLETLPPPVELGAGSGRLVAALVGVPDAESDAGPADEDERGESSSWSVADVVPSDSVAAIALIEHIWAAPLLTAVRRAGGVSLEETWLAAEDIALLEALRAESEA
jgi:hypothetical protein